MRFRAVVAYDGTSYSGFQRQANSDHTIQGRIEDALKRIGGVGCTVVGAGRTDAGVHASGQVISFDLNWKHEVRALRNALNANLPDTIAIREIAQADQDFHPRFDAISRTYQYRLYIAEVADPLRRWYAWHVLHPLDVVAMRDAARELIGTHNFRTFGSPPQGENAVRTVLRAEWLDIADEHHFTITANSFLYRMVRRIVGTLVMVGQRQVTPDEFRGILADRDPNKAGSPAPPQGLTLISVGFPNK